MIPIPAIIIMVAIGFCLIGLAVSIIRSPFTIDWRKDWPDVLMMGGLTIAGLTVILWGILS